MPLCGLYPCSGILDGSIFKHIDRILHDGIISSVLTVKGKNQIDCAGLHLSDFQD